MFCNSPEKKMETVQSSNQASNRIHPLIAGAAVSVMLASLTGVAAMAGLLPNSHSTAPQAVAATAPLAAPATFMAPTASSLAAPVAATPVQYQAPVAVAPVHYQAPAPKAAAKPKQAVYRPKPVRSQPVDYARNEPVRQYSPPPVYQQPAPVAKNSPIGIGVGAVVGGLLGSQVGGGNGRTLATIAGAVGGGYLGNEVAKRSRTGNQ
jgi:hypothetical protein